MYMYFFLSFNCLINICSEEVLILYLVLDVYILSFLLTFISHFFVFFQKIDETQLLNQLYIICTLVQIDE